MCVLNSKDDPGAPREKGYFTCFCGWPGCREWDFILTPAIGR